jgi:hypothetical protein
LTKVKCGSVFHKNPELPPLEKRNASRSLLIIWKVVFRGGIERSCLEEEGSVEERFL